MLFSIKTHCYTSFCQKIDSGVFKLCIATVTFDANSPFLQRKNSSAFAGFGLGFSSPSGFAYMEIIKRKLDAFLPSFAGDNLATRSPTASSFGTTYKLCGVA